MHENIVAAPELAGEGLQKIEWVRRNMPILRKIQSEFEKEQPFAGKRITVCMVFPDCRFCFLADLNWVRLKVHLLLSPFMNKKVILSVLVKIVYELFSRIRKT